MENVITIENGFVRVENIGKFDFKVKNEEFNPDVVLEMMIAKISEVFNVPIEEVTEQMWLTEDFEMMKIDLDCKDRPPQWTNATSFKSYDVIDGGSLIGQIKYVAACLMNNGDEYKASRGKMMEENFRRSTMAETAAMIAMDEVRCLN